MNTTRFDQDIDGSMEPSERGGWVRFEDHIVALLTAAQVERERNAQNCVIKYVGSIMGTTYEWNKGATDPYLIVRELNSGELVKCVYRDEDYGKVAQLFLDKTAVVIIEGLAVYNRVNGKTEIAMAHSFDVAPPFSDSDFSKFFGCAPNLTGSLATDEAISRGREDGE